MEKLREKMVVDGIQAKGQRILHHQQYGSVREHSAMEMVYNSVVSTSECLEN